MPKWRLFIQMELLAWHIYHKKFLASVFTFLVCRSLNVRPSGSLTGFEANFHSGQTMVLQFPWSVTYGPERLILLSGFDPFRLIIFGKSRRATRLNHSISIEASRVLNRKLATWPAEVRCLIKDLTELWFSIFDLRLHEHLLQISWKKKTTVCKVSSSEISDTTTTTSKFIRHYETL